MVLTNPIAELSVSHVQQICDQGRDDPAAHRATKLPVSLNSDYGGVLLMIGLS